MYYTVYKMTNTINGMVYVGVHRTDDLNDGYVGSGLLLKEAFKKYGIRTFKKEILAVFDNIDDMFDMEAKLVNEDFVNDKNTYNVRLGGPGGPKDSKKLEYYKSGQHKKNMLRAREIATKNVPIRKQKRIDEYNRDPRLCEYCETPLPYDKKRNKFCNSSCAASFNNVGRVVSDEQRAKTSASMKARKRGIG